MATHEPPQLELQGGRQAPQHPAAKPPWGEGDGSPAAERRHQTDSAIQSATQTPTQSTSTWTSGGSDVPADFPLLACGTRGADKDGRETEEDAVKLPPEAPWRKILMKILFTVLVFLGLTIALEHAAEKKVSQVSTSIMKSIGLPGLFAFVFLADGLPQPFTYVPLIFIAVKGAVPKTWVFATCAVASYVAAVSGYGTGKFVRSLSWGDNFFAALTRDYPYIPAMMERQGALGVALAALLPVPLALATWTAGSFSLDLRQFLLAAFCRWPKICLFVLLSPSPAVSVVHEAVAIKPDRILTLIA